MIPSDTLDRGITVGQSMVGRLADIFLACFAVKRQACRKRSNRLQFVDMERAF